MGDVYKDTKFVFESWLQLSYTILLLKATL